MFNLFNKSKKPEGDRLILKIDGMHCSSCAVNIDLTLEEVEGVVESKTNYAKSETQLVVDSAKFDLKKVEDMISQMGYKIAEISKKTNN